MALSNLYEDTAHFVPQIVPLCGEHAAPGMEYHVDIAAEYVEIGDDGGTHAALDAVALHCFAEHFARGNANARSTGLQWWFCVAGRLRGSEVRHERSRLFAACLIDALVVRVFVKPPVATKRGTRLLCRMRNGG
jgi:hypothetical protein